MNFSDTLLLLVGAGVVYILSTRKQQLNDQLAYTSESPIPLGNFRTAQLIAGADFYGRYVGLRPNNNGINGHTSYDLILENDIIIPDVSEDNFLISNNIYARLSGVDTVYCNRCRDGRTMDWELLLRKAGQSIDTFTSLERMRRDKLNAEYRMKYDQESSLAQKKILDDAKMLGKIKGEDQQRLSVLRSQPQVYREDMPEIKEEDM